MIEYKVVINHDRRYSMIRNFNLEYWIDNNWYIGKLKEIPGVFSQGETLADLENNIKEVYKLMMEEQADVTEYHEIQTKELLIEV